MLHEMKCWHRVISANNSEASRSHTVTIFCHFDFEGVYSCFDIIMLIWLILNEREGLLFFHVDILTRIQWEVKD